MTVVEIRPDQELQKHMRRMMGRSLRAALNCDNIAGFAFVTWDARGNAHSTFSADTGPIGRDLMPSYVKDQLHKHLTVIIGQECESTKIDGAS